MPELKDVMEAVTELRKTVDSKASDSAESKAKIEKIEKMLDAHEDANQKTLEAKTASDKMIIELNAKMELLEKQASRSGVNGDDEAKTKIKGEIKAFEIFSKTGKADVEEAKYLRTDSGTEGGYLVPQDYVAEMIKNITEVAPIRQLASQRTTSSKSITMPRRTGIPNGGWRSEGQAKQGGQSAYGQLEIFVRSLDVYTDITIEMLQDSAFDMASQIDNDVTEDFAQLEGTAFLYGVEGLNQPEGILNNALVPYVPSGASTTITGDNLIDMQAQLKIGYDGVYLFNRLTLGALRKLKGSTGYYLWTPGFGQIEPTINGSRYVMTGAGIDPNGNNVGMANIAANTYPVLFGDFKRGYMIVDHTSMNMLRDPFSQSVTGKVRFLFNRRVGGKVILPEAFIKLKVATS